MNAVKSKDNQRNQVEWNINYPQKTYTYLEQILQDVLLCW